MKEEDLYTFLKTGTCQVEVVGEGEAVEEVEAVEKVEAVEEVEAVEDAEAVKDLCRSSRRS